MNMNPNFLEKIKQAADKHHYEGYDKTKERFIQDVVECLGPEIEALEKRSEGFKDRLSLAEAKAGKWEACFQSFDPEACLKEFRRLKELAIESVEEDGHIHYYKDLYAWMENLNTDLNNNEDALMQEIVDLREQVKRLKNSKEGKEEHE